MNMIKNIFIDGGGVAAPLSGGGNVAAMTSGYIVTPDESLMGNTND